MQSRSPVVEVIGNHWNRCASYSCELPEVVQEFCRQTGLQVQFIPYRAWDISESSAVPTHIRVKLAAIRNGSESSGFFLNGQWFDSGYHDGNAVVNATQALYAATGSTPPVPPAREYGQALGRRVCQGCTVDRLDLRDCAVTSLVSASSQYGEVVLGSGRIRALKIGESCQIDDFSYRGFDINKLVEVARVHPELFGHAPAEPDGSPSTVDIGQITVRALGPDDLRSGKHPCMIVARPLAPENALYLDAIAKFGAWGYVAEHDGEVCGFLSALPKVSAIRDGSSVTPHYADPERTLLLRCMSSGPVYGDRYARIGIATKMVEAAVRDATRRSYACIEAIPHDNTDKVFEKCGFTRVTWDDSQANPRVFYRRQLGDIAQ